MPAEKTIDVEHLLAPLEGESPTGEALEITDPEGPLLKLKDLWDEARKLVKEEQECERNGGIDSQGQPWRRIPDPDWDSVVDRSVEILGGRSKDFRVAAWLTEALLRQKGAAGLRDGLQLCQGLCEQYWEQLWPQPNDDDGHGNRVGPMGGLVSEANFPAVRRIVVVEGQKAGERETFRYSALDHSRAKELETVSSPEEVAARREAGHPTMTEFLAIAAVTPTERFDQLLADLGECESALSWLGQFFRDNCRDDQYGESTVPALTPFREEVAAVKKLVAELRGEDEVPEESGETGDGAGRGATRDTMSREGAFQAIERIAQYFEKTEPHSPIQFALRQAVRWGRTPFPDLMRELLDDEGTMERLRRLVGLPKPPEEDDDRS